MQDTVWVNSVSQWGAFTVGHGPSSSRVSAWRIGENSLLQIRLDGLGLVFIQMLRPLGSKWRNEDNEMVAFHSCRASRHKLCKLLLLFSPSWLHHTLSSPSSFPQEKPGWKTPENPPGGEAGHTVCTINKKLKVTTPDQRKCGAVMVGAAIFSYEQFLRGEITSSSVVLFSLITHFQSLSIPESAVNGLPQCHIGVFPRLADCEITDPSPHRPTEVLALHAPVWSQGSVGGGVEWLLLVAHSS